MHVTFSTQVEIILPPNSGKKCEIIPERVYLRIPQDKEIDPPPANFLKKKVADFFSTSINLIKKDYKKTGLLASCLSMSILFLGYRAYRG